MSTINVYNIHYWSKIPSNEIEMLQLEMQHYFDPEGQPRVEQYCYVQSPRLSRVEQEYMARLIPGHLETISIHPMTLTKDEFVNIADFSWGYMQGRRSLEFPVVF